jgi:hypothetical protein
VAGQQVDGPALADQVQLVAGALQALQGRQAQVTSPTQLRRRTIKGGQGHGTDNGVDSASRVAFAAAAHVPCTARLPSLLPTSSRCTTACWARRAGRRPNRALAAPLWHWVQANHRNNCLLWAEEDLARRQTVADAEIAANKRAIDRCNQARNDATERVDELLLVALAGRRSLGAVRRAGVHRAHPVRA